MSFAEVKPLPAVEALCWQEAWRCAPRAGNQPFAQRLILELDRPEIGRWQANFSWIEVGSVSGTAVYGPGRPSWFRWTEPVPEPPVPEVEPAG